MCLRAWIIDAALRNSIGLWRILTHYHCALLSMPDTQRDRMLPIWLPMWVQFITSSYLPYAQSNTWRFAREIRLHKASNTAMCSRFVYALSVRLFGLLITMLPTIVICRGQFSQYFAVAETGPHYCPDPADATGTSCVKSRIKCATGCILHQYCISFSYYASSRKCNLYSFAPAEVFNDQDCTLWMVSFHYKHANH